MIDFSHLNDLADKYYYAQEASERASLRSRLWEGAYDLLQHLNLECAIMDRTDLIQELAARIGGDPDNGKPGWIDRYNPNTRGATGGFVGYISANAKLASHNIYRDERSGGFSRRTLEAKNQILDLVHKGTPLQEAKTQVVIDTGMGMDLLRTVEESLVHFDQPLSLDAPAPKAQSSHDGMEATLGDLMRDETAEDPIALVDRSEVRIKLQTMPSRHRDVLQQISEGKDPFTEVDFGQPLTLAEKAATVDAAFKMLKQRLDEGRDAA